LNILRIEPAQTRPVCEQLISRPVAAVLSGCFSSQGIFPSLLRNFFLYSLRDFMYAAWQSESLGFLRGNFSKKVRERAMKPSCLKASWILLSVVLGLGLVLSGCKKEAPPPEEPGAPPVSTEEQAAKEKEFLSDPDVVTCELESTTISKLDFPKDRLPSFVRRMERQSKEVLKQGTITLAGRPFKVLLGERPEREFYLYDVEKKFGPYWWGSWSLHSYHKIDDTFYEFTTVDAGSKIAARPYKGELGVIKVVGASAGERFGADWDDRAVLDRRGARMRDSRRRLYLPYHGCDLRQPVHRNLQQLPHQCAGPAQRHRRRLWHEGSQG
jgi:hypothetical protein